MCGGGEGARTRDLCRGRAAFYPTELRPHCAFFDLPVPDAGKSLPEHLSMSRKPIVAKNCELNSRHPMRIQGLCTKSPASGLFSRDAIFLGLYVALGTALSLLPLVKGSGSAG